ncbi:MAG TPA: nucleoid-associated protein [Armatimonadota bacterium]|nr:nucleoid-associated protein [Armatimonadota bacterium]
MSIDIELERPPVEPAPESPDEMENPPIRIIEVFLHPLDYRSEGVALTDGPLELTPFVVELFGSYIVKGIGASQGRMARFHEGSKVQQVSLAIFAGATPALEGSREIARFLAHVMQGKNSSPGDLAVVRALDTETDQELLAILKLDLQRGLRRELSREDKKTRVRLVPVMDLLPDAERRLQKCAFIPESPHSLPYDLMILDNQAAGRSERSTANFFIADFLECDLIEGPREFTRKLPAETERWLQEEGATPVVAIEAREAVIQALHEPQVDLNRLAESVVPEPEKRERYLAHLEASGFQGRSFSTDASAADRLSSSLTYLLDNGVKISGDAEAVSALLQVEDDPTEEGMVRILIESFRFERKY